MPLKLSPTQAAFNARGDGKFNQSFQEQVDFFRQKLNLSTEHWDDVIKAGHDRAFVVAGAAKADLLADFNSAIDKAIADGKSISWFKKEFENIVKTNGWTVFTGSDTPAGRDWRARVIYNTNLRSSYAAGRYAQLTAPDLLKSRPYWKYLHNDTVAHPRPLHVSWSGLVLKHNDPWWQTHFPPNGFGCRCRVTSVNAGEYKGEKAPDNGTYIKTDLFGNDHIIPKGIDYGWDYVPGANQTTPLKDIIDQKLIRFPAEIGAEMWQALKPVLKAEQLAAVRSMVAIAAASMEPAGVGVVAHVIEPDTVSGLAEHGITLDNAAVWLRDRELIHAIRDKKVDRGASLPLDVWLNLPEYLDGAMPYLDTLDIALLYAFEFPNVAGKVVVRLNHEEKVRDGGQRKKVKSNFIVTGGIVTQENLNDPRYVPLRK
jgi:hypothetical protein